MILTVFSATYKYINSLDEKMDLHQIYTAQIVYSRANL